MDACKVHVTCELRKDDQRSVGLVVGLQPSGWSGWLDWAGPVWVGHLFISIFFCFL